MTPERKRRLEAAGFKAGTVSEFLRLSPEESALVELGLSLARQVRRRRVQRGYSQVDSPAGSDRASPGSPSSRRAKPRSRWISYSAPSLPPERRRANRGRSSQPEANRPRARETSRLGGFSPSGWAAPDEAEPGTNWCTIN